MITYRVIITKRAAQRFREQTHYIAVEAQTPLNAERWLDRVLGAVQSLEHMPRRCPIATEQKFRPGHELRALNVDGYLILFKIDDDKHIVTVVGARHGRQLPRSDDPSRE